MLSIFPNFFFISLEDENATHLLPPRLTDSIFDDAWKFQTPAISIRSSTSISTLGEGDSWLK
jgi:hypothetical protein